MQYLKKQRIKYMFSVFGLALLAVIALLGALYFSGLQLLEAGDMFRATQQQNGLNVWLIAVFVVIVGGIPLVRYFDRRGMNFDHGMIGEAKVARVLDELGEDFTVFHDFQIEKSLDIDFIVIGSSGIFAIEVKRYHYPTERDIQRFIGQVKRETMALRKYIEQRFGKTEWITPVVVLVDLKKKVDLGVREHVHFATPEFLPRLISGQPVLSREAKEALVQTLGR